MKEPTEQQMLLNDERLLLIEIEEIERELVMVNNELATVRKRLNMQIIK